MKRLIAALLFASVCGTAPAFATLSDTTEGRQTRTGDGVATIFVYTFPAGAATDISATVTLAGVLQPASYTVILFSDQINSPGGQVTFTTAPANGSTITLQRTEALTQQTSLSPFSPFPAKVVERTFDGNVRKVQQVDRRVADLETKEQTDISNTIAGGVGAANLIAPIATGTTTAMVLADRFAREIHVSDFLPVNYVKDGSVDYTTQIQAAITAAAGKTLSFCPTAFYTFSSQLVFSGIDVDFCGSDLHWTGPVGVFAMVLDSNSGSGLTQTTGNTFDNFTLYQDNFTAFTTFTNSVTYDAPSIAAGSAISNITPGGTSTTVSVPGATTGGFARATLTTLQDGIELTARVTSPGVVTVTLSNYDFNAIDLASGTLAVTVWNNAYNGLDLSGSLGRVRGAKVRGFTGISVGMGDLIDMTTGISMAGLSRAFYWQVDVNVASAAGWPLVIGPRNNENEFTFGVFPYNAYNDSIPRRATCINMVVLGGLTNKFHRMSLESNCSEEEVLLVGNANLNETDGLSYIEYNTSWATPPFPRIRARKNTSGNKLRFRHPYNGKAIADLGTGNDISVGISNEVNGQQILPVRLGRNLITNGDFENGLSSWSDFGSGGAWAVTGTAGFFSGKRARVDIVAGRPNLQQNIDTAGAFTVAGLVGQNLTCSAYLKTNIPNVKPRLVGLTGNGGTVGDSTDEQISITARIPSTTVSPIALSIITDASGLTGFIELSNVTCYLGTLAGGVGERTAPVGSATFNPPSVAAGGQTSTTVSVPGAALGDFANCSFSLDIALMHLPGYVSATDTVTCLFINGTAGAIDLASGTLRARVTKQ